jgi:hypothetical protein
VSELDTPSAGRHQDAMADSPAQRSSVLKKQFNENSAQRNSGGVCLMSDAQP